MKRRQSLWAGVVVLLLLAIGGLWALHGTHSISLTETQVQERIDKQLGKEFPIKGAPHLLVKTVSVKNAAVHIQDGHVIAVIDLEGTLRTGRKFTLTAYAAGVPAYSFGEFFFKPEKVEVQKFAYEGSTPTELFTRLAKHYISDDKARQFVEDNAPKVEEWMTSIAQNAATHSLEGRPIYRPKDDVTGLLIKASLDSVRIDQDHIVIVFSLWQFTLSVLFGIVCLIAAIILLWIMIKNPLLGVAPILLS